MAGLKYYERTKLLIELIEKKKTGSPKELAVKLGLKVRMIYYVLDDLRLVLGKEISYCKEKKSYIFSEKKVDCKEIALNPIEIRIMIST